MNSYWVKNENIYGLLLTPVKKLYHFHKTIWNSKENCSYCGTCKIERSIELIVKLEKDFVVVILSFISFGVLSEIDMPFTYTLNAWHELIKVDIRGLI